MFQSLQVHAFGGTTGVLFYSLMASKNYVYELYGKRSYLDVNQSCIAALLNLALTSASGCMITCNLRSALLGQRCIPCCLHSVTACLDLSSSSAPQSYDP